MDESWRRYFQLSASRLGVRFGSLVVMVAITTVSVIFDGSVCWPFYMTHWSLVVVDIYLVCAVLASAAAESEGPAPFVARLAFLLQGLALPSAVLVTTLYWGILVPCGGQVSWRALLTNGLNVVVMVIDTAICNQPFFPSHALFFASFLLAYVVWTYVHYRSQLACVGLHRALHWRQPGSKGNVRGLAVLFLAPIFVFLCCVNSCWTKFTLGSTDAVHLPQALDSAPSMPPKKTPLPPNLHQKAHLHCDHDELRAVCL